MELAEPLPPQAVQNPSVRVNREIISVLRQKLQLHIDVIAMLEDQMIEQISAPKEFMTPIIVGNIQSLGERIIAEVMKHEQTLEELVATQPELQNLN